MSRDANTTFKQHIGDAIVESNFAVDYFSQGPARSDFVLGTRELSFSPRDVASAARREAKGGRKAATLLTRSPAILGETQNRENNKTKQHISNRTK